MSPCPFCSKLESPSELSAENDSAAAFPDGFPVSDGHTLVVPKSHVARIEDLERQEWSELFDLVRQTIEEISRQHRIDGVNIGVNSGESAGQTVDHAHVHVIPRRTGDVVDPRGGVRWVLPEKADYWNGA